MSDFMEQFRAGFQMGQTRNENTRRNQDLQMEQERQRAIQQQAMERARREQEAHALNVETQKVNLAKAKLDAKIAARSAAESFGAEQGMEQMQASAAPGGQFTRPGATPIPGMGELAGPPAEGTPTQPAMANLPAIEEVGAPAQQRSGIDVLKALVARQQEAQQAKAQEAFSIADARASAEAAHRQPKETLAEIEAKAAAQARGRKSVGGGEGGGGPRGLTQNAESNLISKLSNQWAAATKTAGDIGRQVSIMETGLEAARRGDLAAGSQAVLVTFQKILDPTSVVRESEYARSASGQALLARMKGAVEQLQKGGAGVPVSELEKFARVARDMANGTRGHLDATKERIGKVADRYGVPRELVIENYDYGSPAAPPPASAAPARPPNVPPEAKWDAATRRWRL